MFILYALKISVSVLFVNSVCILYVMSLVKPTKISWNLLKNLDLKFHFLLLGALQTTEQIWMATSFVSSRGQGHDTLNIWLHYYSVSGSLPWILTVCSDNSAHRLLPIVILPSITHRPEIFYSILHWSFITLLSLMMQLIITMLVKCHNILKCCRMLLA